LCRPQSVLYPQEGGLTRGCGCVAVQGGVVSPTTSAAMDCGYGLICRHGLRLTQGALGWYDDVMNTSWRGKIPSGEMPRLVATTGMAWHGSLLLFMRARRRFDGLCRPVPSRTHFDAWLRLCRPVQGDAVSPCTRVDARSPCLKCCVALFKAVLCRPVQGDAVSHGVRRRGSDARLTRGGCGAAAG
jgi:hypothetical protein